MVAIQGRMQTVGAVKKPQKAIVVGSPILSTQELNSGDKINAYTPQALFLGSASVQSVRVVGPPKGVYPTERDIVFGTTFAGYFWLQARAFIRPLPLLSCHCAKRPCMDMHRNMHAGAAACDLTWREGCCRMPDSDEV